MLRWGILRPTGDTQLDGRLTLLGESIADLFMVASLSGESYHYCFYSAGSEGILAIFFS